MACEPFNHRIFHFNLGRDELYKASRLVFVHRGTFSILVPSRFFLLYHPYCVQSALLVNETSSTSRRFEPPVSFTLGLAASASDPPLASLDVEPLLLAGNIQQLTGLRELGRRASRRTGKLQTNQRRHSRSRNRPWRRMRTARCDPL